MSKFAIQNFNSVLIATDLEPDDFIAILIALDEISKKAPRLDQPFQLGFLVGEGHSGIKLARINAMLDKAKKIGLLDNVNVTTIQGYSHYQGSQKNFITDGREILSEQALHDATSNAPDIISSEDRAKTQRQILEFFYQSQESLVISLKPLHEFQDLLREYEVTLHHQTFVCTGSYNFRASWKWLPPDPALSKSEAEAQQRKQLQREQAKTLTLLDNFKDALVYETHSTTEKNATNAQNAPDLFASIQSASDNSLIKSFQQLMMNWTQHLLQKDREDISQYVEKLSDVLTKEDCLAFNKVRQQDFETSLFQQLKQTIQGNLCKLENNKEPHTANQISYLQKLDRIIMKWKNLTAEGMQFVNADPGLAAVLTGQCDKEIYFPITTMKFNGEYTQFMRPHLNRDCADIYTVIPNTGIYGEHIDAYLEFRDGEKLLKDKDKAAALTGEEREFYEGRISAFRQAQTVLLDKINSIMEQTIKNVLAREAKLEQRLAPKLESPRVSKLSFLAPVGNEEKILAAAAVEENKSVNDFNQPGLKL